ncbi:MAG: hypothetical protein J6D21_01405 [Clostridia bacterium]|nr:hypothetical protein [Clostridia bacterium]
MKLRLTALVLLVSTALSLAACGAVPADTTPTETSPSANSPTVTTPTLTTPADTTPTETTPAVDPDTFYDPATKKIDLSKFNFQEEFSYNKFYASNGIILPYRLYLPPTYSEAEQYPLLVYLHGAGSRGTFNNTPLYEASIYLKHADSPAFHSIMLVPQCPENGWWNERILDAFVELLDSINETYSTDSCRQYITGASMGGDGTWQMLESYADRVSAAIPVASAGRGYVTEDMLDVPIHIIYDDADTVIPTSFIEPMYQQLLSGGNEDAVLTKTSGHGHQICNRFVSETDISALEWLFAQRRETGTKRSADGISRYESFYTYHEFTGTNGITLPYRLYSPENEKAPLLLYLHSESVCGTDNKQPLEEIDRWAPYTSRSNQALILVPQCPAGLTWTEDVIDVLMELMADLESAYGIDLSRRYAVGNGMGADGIWDITVRYPETFAGVTVFDETASPAKHGKDTELILDRLAHGSNEMLAIVYCDHHTAPYYEPYGLAAGENNSQSLYFIYFERFHYTTPYQLATYIDTLFGRRLNQAGVVERIPIS